MELIRNWILGLTGAALLTGAAVALAPRGKWGSLITLVCGFMLLSVLVSPAVGLNVESFSRAIVQYKVNMGAYGAALEQENQRLAAGIIEREAAEYIWDKADELGIGLERITVRCRLEEGPYPYPYAAELTGSAGEEERAALSELIERDLGIAKERQTWN